MGFCDACLLALCVSHRTSYAHQAGSGGLPQAAIPEGGIDASPAGVRPRVLSDVVRAPRSGRPDMWHRLVTGHTPHPRLAGAARSDAELPEQAIDRTRSRTRSSTRARLLVQREAPHCVEGLRLHVRREVERLRRRQRFPQQVPAELIVVRVQPASAARLEQAATHRPVKRVGTA
jgi:hypothetical protein